MPFVIIGTYAPFAAALLTKRLTEGNWKAFSFYYSWKHLLIGLVSGLVIIAVGFVIVPSLILTTGSFSNWNWLAFASYPLGIAYNLLMAGPVGEEPGWRGYALPRLEKLYGAAFGSLILGLLWFGWHLPLFLIPTWTSSAPFAYALLVVGLSFVMTFSFNLSGGSVIVAVLLHSAFNSSSAVLGGFLGKAETRDYPSAEIILAGSFILIALLLIIGTGGRLGRQNWRGKLPE